MRIRVSIRIICALFCDDFCTNNDKSCIARSTCLAVRFLSYNTGPTYCVIAKVHCGRQNQSSLLELDCFRVQLVVSTALTINHEYDRHSDSRSVSELFCTSVTRTKQSQCLWEMPAFSPSKRNVNDPVRDSHRHDHDRAGLRGRTLFIHRSTKTSTHGHAHIKWVSKKLHRQLNGCTMR